MTHVDPDGLCDTGMTCAMERDDRALLAGTMSVQEYRARMQARAAGTMFGLNVVGSAEVGTLGGLFRAVINLIKGKASGAAGRLSDEAAVCRGGTCTADKFVNGKKVTVDAEGKLQNVSVNSADGKTVEQLSQGIPNNQVGTTTVGDVRKAGGDVTPSPSATNDDHSTLSGITPEQAEQLFTPTIPNPAK